MNDSWFWKDKEIKIIQREHLSYINLERKNKECF